MPCKTCKVQLDPEDPHVFCLLHRKCDRGKPCELDADQDKAYWDQVEALTKAARDAEGRRSTRIKTKSAGAERGKCSGSTDPPPLALITDSNVAVSSHSVIADKPPRKIRAKSKVRDQTKEKGIPLATLPGPPGGGQLNYAGGSSEGQEVLTVSRSGNSPTVPTTVVSVLGQQGDRERDEGKISEHSPYFTDRMDSPPPRCSRPFSSRRMCAESQRLLSSDHGYFRWNFGRKGRASVRNLFG